MQLRFDGHENISFSIGENPMGFAELTVEIVEDVESLPFIYIGLNKWINDHFRDEYGNPIRINKGSGFPVKEFTHVMPEYVNTGYNTCRIIFRAELLTPPKDTVEEYFEYLGAVKTAHMIAFFVALFNTFKGVHDVCLHSNREVDES